MTKCTDRGCRNLVWQCKDCGREASSATFANIPGYGEWIRVKDKLPRTDIDGLRTLVTDKTFIAIAQYCFWTTDDKDKEVWSWIMPSDMKKITHWMYLPPASK